MQDNAYVARSLYEYWNDRDFDRLGGLVVDSAEFLIIGSGSRYVGPAGAIEYARSWAEAFPDGKIEVDHLISAGDLVVVEFTGRGTHTGPLRMSGKTVAATGRSITLDLCDVLEIQNERIHSLRSYFDSGSLLIQLGAVMELGTETRVRT